MVPSPNSRSNKKRVRIEDISSHIPETLIEDISKTLTKQIDFENFSKKYAPVADVLKLVGIGVFVAGSLVMPNLPLALKPFLDRQRKNEYRVWKRFNVPYLKRTLNRLEKQKLVEITEENNLQVVKITEGGKRRILKMAIDELAVEKPKIWDGRWTLVSYDLPSKIKNQRKILLEYLTAWGFYPLQESVFLHAYPCQKQIDFLRAYLGIGKYVRLFTVSKIENDKLFRDFFGV
ncbi:hypothetical protein HYZ05_00600 [Candidatus Daviesbacteria bacterium]|nr:hypothetical protein [Candidatus Daviesbacteria bacterium]